MTCESCIACLSNYIDGECAHDLEAELRQHLSACRECREELDAFQRVDAEIRSVRASNPDSPPKSIEIPPQSLPRPLRRRWTSWAAVAAAFFMAFLCAWKSALPSGNPALSETEIERDSRAKDVVPGAQHLPHSKGKRGIWSLLPSANEAVGNCPAESLREVASVRVTLSRTAWSRTLTQDKENRR